MSRKSQVLSLFVLVFAARAGVAAGQSAADTADVIRILASSIADDLRSAGDHAGPALPLADTAGSWTQRVTEQLRGEAGELLVSTTAADTTHALHFRVRSVVWTTECLAMRVSWSRCTRRVSSLNGWVHEIDYEFLRAPSGWVKTSRLVAGIGDGHCDPSLDGAADPDSNVLFGKVSYEFDSH